MRNLILFTILTLVFSSNMAWADCAQELKKVDQALSKASLDSTKNNQIDQLQLQANKALENGDENKCIAAANKMKKVIGIS